MDNLHYIISGIILGFFLSFYSMKYFKKWKLKKRLLKAKKGEHKAIDLVRSHGFEVIDLQKEESYTLFIDNIPRKVTVKADMIVKKGRHIYVAEVKTGNKVT